MKTLMHEIAHLLGWNTGRIEDWREGDRWMIGFRCRGCGRLFHAFQMGSDGENLSETARNIRQRMHEGGRI